MSTDDVTTILAVLATVGVVVGVGGAVAAVLPDVGSRLRAALAGQGVPLAWLVAVVATLGSLYLSEGAHFTPCRLCWYQRIAMYPLVVVLGIGWLRREAGARLTGVVLAGLGLAVNLWHVAVELWPTLEGDGCDPNNPCSLRWVEVWGFWTIPRMATVAFALVLLALALDRGPASRAGARHQPHISPSQELPRPMSHKPTPGRPLARSRVETARSGPRIPVFALAVGALVLVLVVAAVVVAVVGGDDAGELGPGEQAYGPVTATGAPLAEYDDDAEEDPAVGQPAPKLVGESAFGDPVTIDPAEGPMVIAFLAHWCPHCQAEVPRIVDLADGSDEIEGVPFAAVLTATDPALDNFPPGAWLEREDWPAPALVDTEPEDGSIPVAFSSYGVAGYPFLVAIDADGTIAARSSGELGEDGLRDFFAQVAPTE